MKKIDEVFAKFIEFKALVKKDIDKKLNSLRSDNRGEFFFSTFKEFCGKKGISRELIESNNPQQNGVDERKNRSIVGETRAMLHD